VKGRVSITPRIRCSRGTNEDGLDLNYELLYPWGRAKDVVIRALTDHRLSAGAAGLTGGSKLWRFRPMPAPRAANSFRKRNFSFCRQVGIPALRIKCDPPLRGKPALGFGAPGYRSPPANTTPASDDWFQADWDFHRAGAGGGCTASWGSDVANQDIARTGAGISLFPPYR